MKKLHLYIAMLSIALFTLPINSMATPYSYSDLWDINSGATVDSTSGAIYYSSSYRSDIRNMFGAAYGNIEVGNTLFRDRGVSAGDIHFVEWHTAGAVTLRSFALHANNEGMDRRAFSRFQLFSGDGIGNWTSIYDTGAGYSYSGTIDLSVDITAITSQYFRAEFVQAPFSSSLAVGPRIMEFDGFDTFLDGSTGSVPEPSILALMSLGLAGIGFRRKR